MAERTDEPRLERMEREGSLTVQQMDERADEATTLLGGRPKGAAALTVVLMVVS